MPRSQAIMIVGFCLVLTAGSFFTFEFFRGRFRNQTFYPRAKGNENSPFYVVEYMDFLCQACGGGSLILNEYFKKFPSKLYVEYKHFPLYGEKSNSFKAAVAAQCASR